MHTIPISTNLGTNVTFNFRLPEELARHFPFRLIWRLLTVLDVIVHAGF